MAREATLTLLLAVACSAGTSPPTDTGGPDRTGGSGAGSDSASRAPQSPCGAYTGVIGVGSAWTWETGAVADLWIEGTTTVSSFDADTGALELTSDRAERGLGYTLERHAVEQLRCDPAGLVLLSSWTELSRTAAYAPCGDSAGETGGATDTGCSGLRAWTEEDVLDEPALLHPASAAPAWERIRRGTRTRTEGGAVEVVPLDHVDALEVIGADVSCGRAVELVRGAGVWEAWSAVAGRLASEDAVACWTP